MVIIDSVNITENTKIVKSINWTYKNISGTKELDEPNKDTFIEFEELNNSILVSWLENLIDFSIYDVIENTKDLTEKIITVNL